MNKYEKLGKMMHEAADNPGKDPNKIVEEVEQREEGDKSSQEKEKPERLEDAMPPEDWTRKWEKEQEEREKRFREHSPKNQDQ